MADLWKQRYETWLAAGFDQWEALAYMFVGRADWNWWDPVDCCLDDSYPWEVTNG